MLFCFVGHFHHSEFLRSWSRLTVSVSGDANGPLPSYSNAAVTYWAFMVVYLRAVRPFHQIAFHPLSKSSPNTLSPAGAFFLQIQPFHQITVRPNLSLGFGALKTTLSRIAHRSRRLGFHRGWNGIICAGCDESGVDFDYRWEFEL
jgi:hypothetical protein